MNVQAVINNISFPKTLDELRHYIFDVCYFDMEDILCNRETEWTMPKWAVPNDIVFFFHAKTAIATIRRLEIQLNREEPDDKDTLLIWLRKARDIYRKFGGKIFAVGKVLKRPFFDDFAETENLHWSSKIYAAIGDICVLDNPINLEEFSDFIFLSRQSAITAVLGGDFERLKKLILRKNPLPIYIIQSQATPMPLKDINSHNWLIITQSYRRSFFLEIQFRRYFVDYFLKSVGDNKKLFSECACYRNGMLTGYADNCIWIDKRLCFVEVKLNVYAVNRIETQLKKYCYLDEVLLGKEKQRSERLIPNRVMVIDTEKLYFFEAETGELVKILDLDILKDNEDLLNARKAIIRYLNPESNTI